MKNKNGLLGISLLVKIILLLIIIFLIQRALAKEITPEVITTIIQEAPTNIFDTIDRFYEIDETPLRTGYSTTLKNNSAFKLIIRGQEKHIIVNNILETSINLFFTGNGEATFNSKLKEGDYTIFKIGDLFLNFSLDSMVKTEAQVSLKLFEKTLPDIDYFELFDIKITLAEKTIYNPQDLTALIEFTNFGEGPSKIRIIYSIVDTKGKEHHTEINERIVETNEVVIKKFNTLDIPLGEYTIKTTILYAGNKEASSEQKFTLTEPPKIQILKEPLIFISTIIAALFIVTLMKNLRKSNQSIQQVQEIHN
jgi:hypothetical protein